MRPFFRPEFLATLAVGSAAGSPRRALVGFVMLAAVAILPASVAALPTHPAGTDRLAAQSGGVVDFSVIPLPADFFSPGSDPFTDLTPFQGDPIGPGNTDTVVDRLSALDLSGILPTSDVIPIELVALSLTGISPITVTSLGGQFPEPWDIRFDIGGPAPGTLDATKTHPNGGTYSANLTAVTGTFQFTRISDQAQLSIPILSDLSLQGTWVETPVPGAVSTGPNFFLDVSTMTITPNGSTSIYWDNLLFGMAVPVPEPSTAVFLACGLVTLASQRRRLG